MVMMLPQRTHTALEEWEEGLEGVVYHGDFEHVDVATATSLLRYGLESSSLPPEMPPSQ